MKLLISKGLMYGNLIAVDSPALIERHYHEPEHPRSAR
jgi:hypothetical protein